MTTVDTIDDIIRILREQPEAKEAVRRMILSDELLRLPQQLAETSAIVQRTAEIQERHTQFLEQNSRDIDELKTTVKGIASTQVEQGRVLEQHTDSIATLKSDVGGLKGWAAFTPAERRYELIAFEMNLEPVRLLSPGDIAKMTLAEAAQKFDQSELNSFRDCDLIIEARSQTEGECYIAVQVSFTVDHSDISRAIKHAEMVTRFTGKPAFPAVSGVESAHVTERRLSTEAVHMHRLPLNSAQPR